MRAVLVVGASRTGELGVLEEEAGEVADEDGADDGHPAAGHLPPRELDARGDEQAERRERRRGERQAGQPPPTPCVPFECT